MLGSTGKSKGSAFLRTVIAVGAIAVTTILSFVVVAEVYLRVEYADGLSFDDRNGPYVRRFEQDFHFNRFDGPSRGPEFSGPNSGDGPRVLMQGDSITWGQGVKDESVLFPSLLRDRWRSVRPDSEVAVLAEPGRGIDEHLDQLIKWGGEIDPDIIIYQWSLEHIGPDEDHRPLWRRLVFPAFVNNRSYLWFLLDHQIGISSGDGLYEDDIEGYLGEDTQRWRAFAENFRNWAAEAKRHTPSVLIMLYPQFLPTGEQLGEVHDRLRQLAQQEGVMVLDLRQPLAVFSENWTQTYASPLDGNPNEAVHARIAEALYAHMQTLWPGVLGESSDRSGIRIASVPRPASVIIAAWRSGRPDA